MNSIRAFDPINTPLPTREPNSFDEAGMPRDVRALCLRGLDLPDLACASLVSREWNVLASTDIVWRAIAEAIGLPLENNGIPYRHQVLKVVRLLQQRAWATAGKARNLTNLVQIVKPRIADLHSLYRIISARDILLVWNALVIEANKLGHNLDGPDIVHSTTVDQIVQEAEDFGDWFSANKSTLLPISKLNLEGLQLVSLPEEIWQLTNLEELNVEDNQLTAVPEIAKQLPHLINLLVRHNPIPLSNRIVVACKNILNNIKNNKKAAIIKLLFVTTVMAVVIGPSGLSNAKLLSRLSFAVPVSALTLILYDSLNYDTKKTALISVLFLYAMVECLKL